MPERLLTSEEVRDLLRVPQSTLEHWRKNQHGPDYIRVGKVVRYPEKALEKWLSQRYYKTLPTSEMVS